MLDKSLRKQNLYKITKLHNVIKFIFFKKYGIKCNNYQIGHINYHINYNFFFISYELSHNTSILDIIKELNNNDIITLHAELDMRLHSSTLKVSCSIDTINSNYETIKELTKSLESMKKFQL